MTRRWLGRLCLGACFWVAEAGAEADQVAADALGDTHVSLYFQNAQVRQILHMMASLADVNMLISDAVVGRATVHLTEVPWQQALDLILKNNQLGSYRRDSIVVVAPQADIVSQEEAALKSRRLEKQTAPLYTEYIQILYANAAEIAALLTPQVKSRPESKAVILSDRGSVLVDERTNGIILTDTKEEFEKIRRLLTHLDVPVQQVMVEARIVTANTNFSRQLGVRWGAAGDQNGDLNLAVAGSLPALRALRTGGLGAAQALNIDLGVPQASRSGIAVGLIGNHFMLDLELSALVSEGQGEVVARPKIVTADKQSATIVSGVEVPFQETSTSGATATLFKRAAMTLEVKPHITPDRRILMDLKISQDSLGAVVGNTPLINTNQVQTKVLVDNGETVALGGVYRIRQTQSVTKTPLLGDIPLIKWLFRRTSKVEEKQELLIFITPQIVQSVPLNGGWDEVR